MQDSVTDAAEGFSELTTIPLNTIYVNLERTQAGSGLLGETQNQVAQAHRDIDPR